MLLIVIVELPVLSIVNVACADDPASTLPKFRLPLKPMIRMGVGTPVPDAAMVFTPLVMSALTVTVPL